MPSAAITDGNRAGSSFANRSVRVRRRNPRMAFPAATPRWPAEPPSQPSTSLHRTRSEAISARYGIARSPNRALVIHGRDGGIRDHDVQGVDAFPPKDREKGLRSDGLRRETRLPRTRRRHCQARCRRTSPRNDAPPCGAAGQSQEMIVGRARLLRRGRHESPRRACGGQRVESRRSNGCPQPMR